MGRAGLACPYCGESIEIVVDPFVGHQDYIEDCQVCCKPIHLRVSIARDGEPTIEARGEHE